MSIKSYALALLFVSLFPLSIICQSDLECLQGIWTNKQYEDFPDQSILLSINFDIIKDNQSIHFTDFGSENNNLYHDVIGFTDQEYDGTDEIEFIDVKNYGKYFVWCGSDSSSCWINYVGSFYCDEGMYYTNPRPENWAYKIDTLPYSGYQKLYSLQIENGRDYISEFLGITVRSICVPELDVFDAIDGNKVGYLVTGDLVEILEEQPDWVKVKYLKTGEEYWIYDSCLQ